MKLQERSHDQLKEHYEVERELATRLRHASREERRTLYAKVYDELYRRIPHHSQLTRKADPEAQRAAVSRQIQFLKHFLMPESVFLELGPGDCSLSFAVAGLAGKVYAVDISEEITKSSSRPDNFKLFFSDGCSVPVPPGTVSIAYSYQLMEHLHPDDAIEQVRNVYTALAPEGVYVCVSPNRLTGPHDISKFFANEAEGFHLKEYTATELVEIFRMTGFSRVRCYLAVKVFIFRVPVACIRWVESILGLLPQMFRAKIVKISPLRQLLEVRVAAVK